MNEQRIRQILTAWDNAEELEPDRSTEYLMEIVSQECNCDNGDVAEALSIATDDEGNRKPKYKAP